MTKTVSFRNIREKSVMIFAVLALAVGMAGALPASRAHAATCSAGYICMWDCDGMNSDCGHGRVNHYRKALGTCQVMLNFPDGYTSRNRVNSVISRYGANAKVWDDSASCNGTAYSYIYAGTSGNLGAWANRIESFNW